MNKSKRERKKETTINKELFASRLQEVLKEQNLTQLKLAELIAEKTKTEPRPATVNDWIKGKRTPSIQSINYLEDILNVGAQYLTGRSDDRTNWSRYTEEHKEELTESLAALRKVQAFNNYLVSIGIELNSISDISEQAAFKRDIDEYTMLRYKLMFNDNNSQNG